MNIQNQTASPTPSGLTRALVHSGSVKDIFEDPSVPGTLVFRYSDRFSVFDCGPHPQEIPGMGVALCACSVVSFKAALVVGVRTHFICSLDERTIRVKRYELGGGDEPVRRLPLEFIDRQYLSGSLLRDFLIGKKNPRNYGFSETEPLYEGKLLPWPIHQITTKLEKVDRPLNAAEACTLAEVFPEELAKIWSVIDALNSALALVAKTAGYVRFDGKKEVALDNGRVVIIDAFGNPHEDRFVPANLFLQNRITHHSKEYLRQIFIKNGFYEKVKAARATNAPQPEYPLLSDGEIAEASEMFATVAESFERAAALVL